MDPQTCTQTQISFACGSAHIVTLKRTCMGPPFVYTGLAEQCKFLNGKVCKFLMWSEEGQSFTGTVPRLHGLV